MVALVATRTIPNTVINSHCAIRLRTVASPGGIVLIISGWTRLLRKFVVIERGHDLKRYFPGRSALCVSEARTSPCLGLDSVFQSNLPSVPRLFHNKKLLCLEPKAFFGVKLDHFCTTPSRYLVSQQKTVHHGSPCVPHRNQRALGNRVPLLLLVRVRARPGRDHVASGPWQVLHVSDLSGVRESDGASCRLLTGYESSSSSKFFFTADGKSRLSDDTTLAYYMSLTAAVCLSVRILPERSCAKMLTRMLWSHHRAKRSFIPRLVSQPLPLQ